MKRTKGKWTDELSNYKIYPPKAVNVSAVDEKGIVTGCIYYAPYSEETRANARLIAAAPELLEALIMLKNGLDYMQQTDDGEHILNAEYVELIIKTINKATL